MELSPSQVIVLATPVFLLMIAAEIAWGLWRGRNTYRVNDAGKLTSMRGYWTMDDMTFG